MFIRNAWYAAGFSDEFGQALTARTFLCEAVVIYRRRDGAPVAFEDRCAHRRLPLSMGRLVEGDQIECGYHGLVYDCTGTCVKIPGQSRASIPAGAKVRAYPVLDRHCYLWIWMGDPALADPAAIPDFGKLEKPGTARHRISLHLPCHFQLVVDNLLDLSHLAYVHATTTGNAALAEDAVVKTVRDGDTVEIKRWVRNVPPSRTFVDFGKYQGRVNLWQVSQYAPPTYIRVSYGSSDAGVPMSEEDDIWSHGHWGFDVFHGLTPETERTTHQFRHVGYNPAFGDAAAIDDFLRQCDQIINEDREIFIIQQRALDSDPRKLSARDPRSTAPIHADQGLSTARRIHEQRLNAEMASVSAASSRELAPESA
ncbi:MAG TPA: aromatic ring-hydroxylating dioxygenase subunit alpha [Casimicrobiaceae bacterium]|nr:aromatic ring-hydroxylating dioxygenase subunit alpha [Casimicrobiaceae bacterium]